MRVNFQIELSYFHSITVAQGFNLVKLNPECRGLLAIIAIGILILVDLGLILIRISFIFKKVVTKN